MRQYRRLREIVIIGMMLASAAVSAQTKKASPKKEEAKKSEVSKDLEEVKTEIAGAAEEVAQEVAEPPQEPTPENTLEACQDTIDNDLDGHADCDDQDCEIYAVCATPNEAEEKPAEPFHLETPPPRPEQAWQCRDGVDNDNNGLVDCHESACQLSRYCKRLMYERPEPPNKAPGLMVNFGFGVALPNYRFPTSKVDSMYGEVPFDPDIGAMLDLQVSYMFLKWLGAGLNLKSAITGATNRVEYLSKSDDHNDYKYLGYKFWGNFGGFVRFQWPFKRMIPYLNIHVGYSATQYSWHVYDPDNTWEEIYDYEDDDSRYIIGERDEQRVPESGRSRHFVFALEPGFDAFPVSRLFGVGIRAWLPVVGNEHSSYDNVGVLLNFTFTPLWREPPRLKPEYAK
jgi:hypothetical protein